MHPEGAPGYTAEERAVLEGIDRDAGLPDGPVPMLPLARLYVRDVPVLCPPRRSGADLLQVLWRPFDHPDRYMPRTALVWRSAAAVTDVLAAPPEPVAVEFEEYVPVPCVLAPEQVTQYPDPMEPGEDVPHRQERERSGAARSHRPFRQRNPQLTARLAVDS